MVTVYSTSMTLRTIYLVLIYMEGTIIHNSFLCKNFCIKIILNFQCLVQRSNTIAPTVFTLSMLNLTTMLVQCHLLNPLYPCRFTFIVTAPFQYRYAFRLLTLGACARVTVLALSFGRSVCLSVSSATEISDRFYASTKV